MKLMDSKKPYTWMRVDVSMSKSVATAILEFLYCKMRWHNDKDAAGIASSASMANTTPSSALRYSTYVKQMINRRATSCSYLCHAR